MVLSLPLLFAKAGKNPCPFQKAPPRFIFDFGEGGRVGRTGVICKYRDNIYANTEIFTLYLVLFPRPVWN